VKIACFDCFSGVSGDMCLAAMISAGWPAEELMALPRRLGLEGVTIETGRARRGPFEAARVDVRVEGRQPHRHLRHLRTILEQADLSDTVRARALRVFERLAAAEAEVHGETVEKVHFHEVGAADALVDVVGTVEGLSRLGVERVYSTALRLGRGSVHSEHGRIPVPAPATALLLRGAPVEIPEVDAELVTPTGAALLATLVEDWSAPPPFTLLAVGTGAGAREIPDHPNVLRIFLGEARDGAIQRRRIAVIETALDDENPQVVAAVAARVLEHGARDVMTVPATMKKGRLGTWLVVIADPADADALARMILEETGTLGVRVRHEERFELERRMVEVTTRFGAIALKIARLPDGSERAVPEFDSVRDAAARSGRPHREIHEAALAAWGAGNGHAGG
jgi:uncharacterized protein (TIGR00299 family) protein